MEGRLVLESIGIMIIWNSCKSSYLLIYSKVNVSIRYKIYTRTNMYNFQIHHWQFISIYTSVYLCLCGDVSLDICWLVCFLHSISLCPKLLLGSYHECLQTTIVTSVSLKLLKSDSLLSLSNAYLNFLISKNKSQTVHITVQSKDIQSRAKLYKTSTICQLINK